MKIVRATINLLPDDLRFYMLLSLSAITILASEISQARGKGVVGEFEASDGILLTMLWKRNQTFELL